MQLQHFILCDDIRQEVNNKKSLMGLYGDVVTLQYVETGPPTIAIRLGVSIRCSVETREDRPTQFELRVTPPTGIEDIVTVQPIASSKDEHATPGVDISLIADQFLLAQPGLYTFRVKFLRDGTEKATFAREIRIAFQLANEPSGPDPSRPVSDP